MVYSIFRNSLLLAEVKPLDSSELSQIKQSEDIIRLNFVLDSPIDFQIGDYIAFKKTDSIYKLNKKPRLTESPSNFQYECIFEGALHDLKKTKIFLSTPKPTSGNYTDYKFPLTGNAQTFLTFIVSNLNRNGGAYIAGTYKSTATQTVQFNNWNAFEAISQLSELLGFSWYLNGNILHFDEKGFDTLHVFQVGRKLGFTSLTRTRVESSEVETVVYGYGSTQNLPPQSGQGLTENRLSFGTDSKLEKNVSQFGRIESIQEFDNIKPERIGAVTSVDSANPNILYDSTIDFDINGVLLAGIKPKISFLSGSLLGLTFEFAFDYATKRLTLDNYTDESGTYPNTTLKPVVGNQYTLIDIALPSAYLTAARARLQAATQSYLDNASRGLEYYEGNVDEAFIEEGAISLNIGDLVRVISSTFNIDNLYEIKELTQNITNPNLYTLKFGDVLPKSLINSLRNLIFTTQQEIYNVQNNTYSSNEVINQITNNNGETLEWQTL